MVPIEMVHAGGSRYTAEVVGRDHGNDPKLLILRWGMAGEYLLDVVRNQLVTMKGGRITKRIPWGAVDRGAAEKLWHELVPSTNGRFK